MGAGENLVIKAPCEGRANPRGRSPDSCPRCQRALVGTSHVALGRAALSLVLCKSRSWVTSHPHACAPGVSPLSTWLPTLALALPAPGPLHVLSPPPESLPSGMGPAPSSPPSSRLHLLISAGELGIARGSGHVYRPSPQQHRWSAPWSVVPSVPTSVRPTGRSALGSGCVPCPRTSATAPQRVPADATAGTVGHIRVAFQILHLS